MPRKRKNTPDFRINDVVRTISDLNPSRLMLAKSKHTVPRKADCVGHVEKTHKGEVFVLHVGDACAAAYDPEELIPASSEAFWRYYHPVEGVHGYSEFRTYVQAVKRSKERGEKEPDIRGPFYETKDELEEDFALPVRSMFELLSDDDD